MQDQKKGAYQRLFLLLLCLFSIASQAETACPASHLDELARVRYVHDGDTVHLEDGRKIRLIGINSPELARDNRPQQAFAQQARATLHAAIFSHGDRVGLVFGDERKDRYQRTLAHLFTPDGENLQARLLQQGMAAAITHPPNSAFSACYARQERIARCAGSGIWSQPGTTVINAANLDAGSSGFQLVTGEVEQVSQSDKGVRIDISHLLIGINAENLAEFDAAALDALSGKRLLVRGWLHPARTKQKNKSRDSRAVKFYMRIRHPSDMEIIPAGPVTKC